MYRIIKFTIISLLSVFFIIGCQSGGHVQFVVPGIKQNQLSVGIIEIAIKFGMTDRLSESKAVGSFIYYQVGGPGSYFMIGARNHKDNYIIDLIAYEAGLYDKDKFKMIKMAISEMLSNLYENSVTVLEGDDNLIRIERTDT